MDGQTDGWTDRGHNIIRPVFDARIKIGLLLLLSGKTTSVEAVKSTHECNILSDKDISPCVLQNKVFTIYGHGGRIGHVTWKV